MKEDHNRKDPRSRELLFHQPVRINPAARRSWALVANCVAAGCPQKRPSFLVAPCSLKLAPMPEDICWASSCCQSLQLLSQRSAQIRNAAWVPVQTLLCSLVARAVSKLCGSAKSHVFPFESNCQKSLFRSQFLPCMGYGCGAPETDGLWHGVLLMAWFPRVGPLPVTVGHICSPKGLCWGDRRMDQLIKAFGNGKHSYLWSGIICNFYQMSPWLHPYV